LALFHSLGSDCYKYDDAEGRVATGYPKSITAEFGGGSALTTEPAGSPVPTSAVGGCNESVPADGLDAVFFDATDVMIHFYKGEWVSG